jgi:phosphate transport system substrate-binding protein
MPGFAFGNKSVRGHFLSYRVPGLRHVFVFILVISCSLLSPRIGFSQSLTISGSSMLYPLERSWIAAYMKKHPESQILVFGTDSKIGLESAYQGNISIGASDAYLSRMLKRQYPGLIPIPVALGAAEVVYNLPGIRNGEAVKLDGPVLAGIFLGSIRSWDAQEIRRLNPGIHFPRTPVRVVHRSDSSGTTFVVTDYLSRTSKNWEARMGRDMSPEWPTGIGAEGSEGVAKTVRSTPGAIGYVGFKWARKYGLSSAAMKNHDGFYVLASKQSLRRAAIGAFKNPHFLKDPGQSIAWRIRGKGVYPIVNFEYWVVSPHLDSETMQEIRALISWTLGTGQEAEFLDGNGFVPLPLHSYGPNIQKKLIQLLPGNSYKVNSPG